MHCEESADHVNEDKALKCFTETGIIYLTSQDTITVQSTQ
jgi:hypothetical protein